MSRKQAVQGIDKLTAARLKKEHRVQVLAQLLMALGKTTAPERDMLSPGLRRHPRALRRWAIHNRLQLVEPSLEERVSNLLDYFQWVRDATLVQKASQMRSTKSSENATTAPDLLGR
jgi:hypothetical protein